MGSFDNSLEYDVKRTIMKTYEMMIIYKSEQLRKEKDNDKKDKIEVEIYELINSI